MKIINADTMVREDGIEISYKLAAAAPELLAAAKSAMVELTLVAGTGPTGMTMIIAKKLHEAICKAECE